MMFAFLAILGAAMMAAALATASIFFKMVTILFGAFFLVSVYLNGRTLSSFPAGAGQYLGTGAARAWVNQE
jgi:hypothetical protein